MTQPNENTPTLQELQALAEQGDAAAQCELGLRYANGIDTEKDLAKAHHYFTLSAEQGNARGECALGVWYEKGYDGEPNPKQAYLWFRKSAEQGFAESQSA